MVLAQLSATQSRPLAQARRVPAQTRRIVVARAQQRQNLAQIAGAAAAASLLLVRVAWCLITMHQTSLHGYWLVFKQAKSLHCHGVSLMLDHLSALLHACCQRRLDHMLASSVFTIVLCLAICNPSGFYLTQ